MAHRQAKEHAAQSLNDALAHFPLPSRLGIPVEGGKGKFVGVVSPTHRPAAKGELFDFVHFLGSACTHRMTIAQFVKANFMIVAPGPFRGLVFEHNDLGIDALNAAQRGAADERQQTDVRDDKTGLVAFPRVANGGGEKNVERQ